MTSVFRTRFEKGDEETHSPSSNNEPIHPDGFDLGVMRRFDQINESAKKTLVKSVFFI